MSSPGGMQGVLARIATVSSPPSAVTRLQARFGMSLASAMSATTASTVTPADITTTPAAGVENTVRTAATNTTITTTGATASTSTATSAPTGALDGAAASGAAADWASRLPAAGQPWAAQIEEAATKYGIAPEFLGAVVWTESSFNPSAVSPDGAVGLGQLMPATAAWLGVDPWNPAQNLDGSARYYRNLIDRFGAIDLATAAYFSGPTAVKNAGGIPTERSQDYVAKVLGRRDTLAGV